MRIEAVVVNASPLIALFRSGQTDLLPRLFGRVVVPDAVREEVATGGHWDAAAEGIAHRAPWAVQDNVPIAPRVAAWNLGAGETSVLSYALASPALRAMVDDREARRCAQTLGTATLGTGGMLVLAKRRGLIVSVEAGLQRLSEAGLWLSADLVAMLKSQAGEGSQRRAPRPPRRRRSSSGTTG